ncbi:hypothetical protein GCM10010266_11920 [Streptomyces griseomycini]|uniref:hypothetical protein n=1 Tax=Streptomyces griseomycini TaxID=66895 RepID=UPI001873566D|nr:hypothetical protein [Streptomyces griseomycini]GGP90888.1 hypothetical protein GCM10010266_11920 [Streptomyces griseomycini]
MTWSEAEYLEYLESEQRAFAWVMRRYGGLTPAKAWEEALECYPYEPAGHPCRGLVFHDEAWHWAMLTIHGDWYVVEHPELVGPPAEYEALR